MRSLDSMIRAFICNLFLRQTEGSTDDVIGPDFIGCDPGGSPALFLQQCVQQLQRRLGVTFRLHEVIQDLAFSLDPAP